MKRALILLPLLLGCGYQAGQVAGGEGLAVAVPAFENHTFRRGLERDLTRAVHEEILRRSRFRLVDESQAPDLVLRGVLGRARESIVSEDEENRIRESSVLLSVSIVLEDLRTGDRTEARRSIVERQAFVPRKGESIRSAELAAIRTLAEKIVYALQSDW